MDFSTMYMCYIIETEHILKCINHWQENIFLDITLYTFISWYLEKNVKKLVSGERPWIFSCCVSFYQLLFRDERNEAVRTTYEKAAA